jgi:hypothetical protein
MYLYTTHMIFIILKQFFEQELSIVSFISV